MYRVRRSCVEAAGRAPWGLRPGLYAVIRGGDRRASACAAVPAHVLGLGDPCVPFDGIQGQVQPTGTVQQSDTGVQQVVDLVPSPEGGGLASVEFPDSGGRGPASAVHGDLLASCLGEVVPDVPPAPDPQGVRDGLLHGVASGAVSADDLDARVLAQPPCEGVGSAVGQDIDALAGLGVDQDRGVGAERRGARMGNSVVGLELGWPYSSRSRRSSRSHLAKTPGGVAMG